jgi:hypothetical protein
LLHISNSSSFIGAYQVSRNQNKMAVSAHTIVVESELITNKSLSDNSESE